MQSFDRYEPIVKEFFDQTDRYLHKRYGIQMRKQIIRELLPMKCYSKVLDVGCGDGSLVLDYLEAAESISMIDLSENMLDLAKKNIESLFPEKKANIKYLNQDFMAFQPESQFDLVLVIGVLAHVSDIQQMFEKLAGVVKPGGTLVIQYSDSNNLMVQLRRWWHRRKSGYRLAKLDRDSIARLFNSCNFTVVGRRRFNFQFFGMKYLGDRTLFRLQCWIMKRSWLRFSLSDEILVLRNGERNSGG